MKLRYNFSDQLPAYECSIMTISHQCTGLERDHGAAPVSTAQVPPVLQDALADLASRARGTLLGEEASDAHRPGCAGVGQGMGDLVADVGAACHFGVENCPRQRWEVVRAHAAPAGRGRSRLQRNPRRRDPGDGSRLPATCSCRRSLHLPQRPGESWPKDRAGDEAVGAALRRLPWSCGRWRLDDPPGEPALDSYSVR